MSLKYRNLKVFYVIFIVVVAGCYSNGYQKLSNFGRSIGEWYAVGQEIDNKIVYLIMSKITVEDADSASLKVSEIGNKMILEGLRSNKGLQQQLKWRLVYDPQKNLIESMKINDVEYDPRRGNVFFAEFDSTLGLHINQYDIVSEPTSELKTFELLNNDPEIKEEFF